MVAPAQQRRRYARQRNRGFTLVELMVAVTIVAIFMGIAMPSFTTLTGRIKAKSVASELHATLLKARSEALMRNVSIEVRPKSGNWKNGWTVAYSAATVLLDDRGETAGVTVTGPVSVTFNAAGRLPPATPPPFIITSLGANPTITCVSVDLSGRPYSKVGDSC
ncbi:MAG: GspH/FimT family pseudopilin [Herminiimonas sp.]|nr:GspH/FimT family pseudopilin [Herminiimonas sp.]